MPEGKDRGTEHVPCKLLTQVQVMVETVKCRTERNEEDIQKIFSSVSRLPYIIIGSVLIPTLLLIYQLFIKR